MDDYGQDDVDYMRYLSEEDGEQNDGEEKGECSGKKGSVPSLLDLCASRIGHDLPLYVADYPATTEEGTGEGGTDDGEDAEEGRQALMELMGLLPSSCLERISLSASRHQNITDETLPLLCHPHVRRLVLVGTFTDRGLSHALFPHQASGGRRPSFSWEDDEDGSGSSLPDDTCMSFRGCLELESLVLSSPSMSPACLPDLAARIPSVRDLRLWGCFDTCFLSQQEILRDVRSLRGVAELDLRGCQWLTEKGLLRWLEIPDGGVGEGKVTMPLPALARLVCNPHVATVAAQSIVKRIRPTVDLVAG